MVLDRPIDGGIDPLEPLWVKSQRRRGCVGEGCLNRVKASPYQSQNRKPAQLCHRSQDSRTRPLMNILHARLFVKSIVAWRDAGCNGRVGEMVKGRLHATGVNVSYGQSWWRPC